MNLSNLQPAAGSVKNQGKRVRAFKLRHKLRAWLGPLLIMILVLIAFPLSIDISQYDLNKFYFSVIVVSLLMISFLATESIFSEDYEDGSLEQTNMDILILILPV